MISDIGNKQTLISCLLALVFLVAACGGNSISLDSSPNPPATVDLAEFAPGLPGLDGIRESSVINPVQVDPTIYLQSGGTVTDQSPDLLLDSDAGMSSWAMYGVPLGGEPTADLTLEFSFPGEMAAWAAVANYSTGRWQWMPVISLNQAMFDLSPSLGFDYESPLGNFYLLILSYNGADALVTGITVDIGTAPPTFMISGTIVDDGSVPLAGVLVNLSPAAGSTNTGVDGTYSFTGLDPGPYTLTPEDAGFDFAPLSMDVTIVDADFPGQDFVGTAVAAKVTYDADIAPLLNGSGAEASCIGCHGGISPTLETFAQVSSNASAVLESVIKSSDWMPPNGPQWSQASIDLFEAWIAGGKLEN